MKFLRDMKVEHNLRQLGVEFKIETVKIREIDFEESLNRQVRVGKKIDDDLVLQYAEAMTRPGAAFPMCIVNRLKTFSWFASGNHRGKAFELCDINEFDAYVISVTDPRIIDLIPRVVNTWEGKRPGRDEMLINAAYMIDTYKMEIKDAARQFSLKPEWIVTYMRQRSVADEIRNEGINPAGMPKTLLTKLAPLQGNKNILRETTKLLKKHDIGWDETVQIIDEVKAAVDESSAIGVTKRWDGTLKSRTEKKPAPFKTQQRTTFLTLLGRLRNFLVKVEKASELQLGESDLETTFEAWNEIERKMKALVRQSG